MKDTLPVAAIVLGVVLVAASLVWGLIFPATNQWTPERAKEMSQLSDEVHLLMFKAVEAKERPNMVKGGNPAEVIAEYEQKKKQLASLKSDLDNIKDAPQTSAKYLRWSGIAFVLLGGAASMVTRER